ncbi:hypothetical protein ScalyP_jg11799 [Parmales sp. scaly parma]|nr:hypothetical protein ScalyP_jg11799 [Parmales sp. scaly parma]
MNSDSVNDENLKPSSLSLKAKAIGRWTLEEHQLFLEGMNLYGKGGLKDIQALIQTRTMLQIRTHAQKCYPTGWENGVGKENNETKQVPSAIGLTLRSQTLRSQTLRSQFVSSDSSSNDCNSVTAQTNKVFHYNGS